MNETRQVFAGLSQWEIDAFYGLAVVSISVFLWGTGLLVAKYRRGHQEPLRNLPSRVVNTLWLVFSHRTIGRRDPVVAVGHFLIFAGFMVLLAGTTVLGIQVDITKPVFNWSFWMGGFYLAFKLCLDLAGTMLLAGLVVLAVRRGVLRPPKLDYQRPDRSPQEYDRRRYVVGDWVFVSTLIFLCVTGFLVEGLDLVTSNPSFAGWSPVGWAVEHAFIGFGLDASQVSVTHHALWWVHVITAFVFVASVPFTKAVHMVAGPANLAVKDDEAGRRLKVVEATSEQIGYGTIADMSWRHLLSLDACTKCGKCHEACPANAGGYPLSPRDLVLDLREAAAAALGPRSLVGAPPLVSDVSPLLGNTIRPETLWSCTQCMACVEICPVGIEQAPIINQFRRRLVDEGRIETTLQATLETIYTTGNSFGEAARKRGRWAKELDFHVKDIRKERAELLWFVGDYASFDPRNQKASRALAQVLHRSGVDFGVLFDAEKTGGCDVRRVGEEGLFTSLAEQNIRTISGCEFERIFSSDPHSFHTLKNEYPQFGGTWTVLHHSELLLELFDSGRIVPRRVLPYRVTYHDPCTLGRYNGVYDAPRRVLKAIGAEVIEMPRNRDNSFCCGAGGGRIWMKEAARPSSRRPSEQRIDEAVGLGDLDYFVVACPKDVTMYEDAIRTSGHEGRVRLKELSELVLESLDVG